jgi:predicted nucleic acid-binding protein
LENKGLTVGLDTNILCYALDPAYPEHRRLAGFFEKLSPQNMVALNPTVFHEAYHVLVYCLEWESQEAAQRLTLLLKHPYISFFNQTKQTTQAALKLAVKHALGGRDALIVANYLTNRIPLLYTHDQTLLELKSIAWKDASMTFEDPIKSL